MEERRLLRRLTIATKVYRGVSGLALPPQFWKANQFGVCGGVESAFMSTTADRGVVESTYANIESGKAPTIIQAMMGMIDRGADLDWLSQFPGEKEVR